MNRKGFLKSIAMLAVAPKIISEMELSRPLNIMDLYYAFPERYLGTQVYFDKFGKLINNGYQSKTIQ